MLLIEGHRAKYPQVGGSIALGNLHNGKSEPLEPLADAGCTRTGDGHNSILPGNRHYQSDPGEPTWPAQHPRDRPHAWLPADTLQALSDLVARLLQGLDHSSVASRPPRRASHKNSANRPCASSWRMWHELNCGKPSHLRADEQTQQSLEFARVVRLDGKSASIKSSSECIQSSKAISLSSCILRCSATGSHRQLSNCFSSRRLRLRRNLGATTKTSGRETWS